MAKNKTTETIGSVTDFLNTVADETKRADSLQLIELFENQTGFKAKMWGASIVGFGIYHYKYDSGHAGEAPLAGFSPRKDAISLYLSLPDEARQQLLAKFGKYKTGKSCIYIKKLIDINTDVLKEMVSHSVKNILKQYPD